MNSARDQARLSSIDGVTLNVNDATVIGTNVAVAADGLIHGIDAVLFPPFMSRTIVNIISDTPSFTTLASLLIKSELEDILAGPGPFTLFAPTNDAFSADLSTAWQLDNATLKDILNFHVVAGMIPWTEMVDGLTLTTVQGGTISFSVHSWGSISIVISSVDGASRSIPVGKDYINSEFFLASNGIVHTIGGVMMPTTPTEIPEVMTATP
jgi:uncharacterized surface protein with fasciclin (FAS1) repeats